MISKAAVGSTNKTKEGAVRDVLTPYNIAVIAYAARSEVNHQPLSEAETRQGAISRAKDCLKQTDAELAFGLEAGVYFVDEEVYLCQWGALVDRSGSVYVSNAPVILMPKGYKAELEAGEELEDIMHRYTGIQDLGKREGAVGIFTQNLITRRQMMADVIKVLWGQYLYYSTIHSTSVS